MLGSNVFLFLTVVLLLYFLYCASMLPSHSTGGWVTGGCCHCLFAPLFSNYTTCDESYQSPFVTNEDAIWFEIVGPLNIPFAFEVVSISLSIHQTC